MLDLNNITQSTLLVMNTQDSLELESSPELKEDLTPTDDAPIDPNAFVLLLSQVALNPIPETKDHVSSESTDLVDTTYIEKGISQETHAINTVDENVAVAWINSEYYQAEINMNQTSTVPEMQLNEQIADSDEKADFNVEINNQMTHSLNNAEVDGYRNQLATPQHTTLPLVPGHEKHFLSMADTSVNSSMIELEGTLDQIDPDLLKLTDEQNTQVKPGIKTDAINTNIPEKTEENMDVLTLSSKNLNPNNLTVIESTELNQSEIFNHKSIILKQEAGIEGDDYLDESNALSIQTEQVEYNAAMTSKANIEMSGHTPIFESIQNNELSMVENLSAAHVPNDINYSSSISEGSPEFLSTTPQSLAIFESIEDPQWSKQFSEHVIWLGQQGVKSAVIKIHPEDLGPLEISIKVVNNSAIVNIMSDSVHVREIIDGSLPLLQEMMAEQGLNLSEVNIDSNTDAQHSSQQNNSSSEESLPVALEEDVSPVQVKKKTAPQGTIDYFA